MHISDKYLVLPHATAASPFSGNSLGKTASRLQLKGFLKDSHFFIKTTQILNNECFIIRWTKLLYAYFYCVKLEINGNQILLNINSLAKRLLLTKKEITSSAKNGTLHELIESRAELSFDSRIIREQLQASYTNSSTNHLIGKKMQQETDLSPETLASIADDLSEFFREKGCLEELKNGGLWFEVDGKGFLASINHKKIHIIHYQKSEPIGKGATSSIFKILNVTTGKFEVLKIINKVDKDKEDALYREISILNEIKSNSNHRIYFQPPPTCKFDVQSLDGSSIMGYAGKLFDKGDLKKWLDNEHTPLERLNCCKHVIKGIDILYKDHQILHMDIKPDNIVTSKKGNFKLIDFGEAYKLDQVDNYYLKEEEQPLPAGTPLFLSQADLINLKKLHQKFHEKNANKKVISKRLDLASEKRVIFSLGITCFEVLSKELPYAIQENQYCIPSRTELIEDPLLRHGYPVKLISFLKKMIDHDPKNRPTMAQTAKMWETFNCSDIPSFGRAT